MHGKIGGGVRRTVDDAEDEGEVEREPPLIAGSPVPAKDTRWVKGERVVFVVCLAVMEKYGCELHGRPVSIEFVARFIQCTSGEGGDQVWRHIKGINNKVSALIEVFLYKAKRHSLVTCDRKLCIVLVGFS